MRFNPNFIFIDDNIGRLELQETLKQLSSNRKTKDVPITVLKSSNYHEALGASSVLDYLLKQNLSADALYNTVKNSFRFRRTQALSIQDLSKEKKGIILSASFRFDPVEEIPFLIFHRSGIFQVLFYGQVCC